jgi:hypothetical protein
VEKLAAAGELSADSELKADSEIHSELSSAGVYRNIPAREARAARWPGAASSVLFGVHVFVGGGSVGLWTYRAYLRPVAAAT